MTDFPWTDEQKAVLASKARITLVQAGPGSGKTKVFAELVNRRVNAWPYAKGGLAALSFTNVAREEIEERVCASMVAPHFVGTLDAFFLRFVIGPFGHLVGLPKSGARLIPSPLDQHLNEPAIKLGDKQFASIFQITATGGTEDAPQFQFRPPTGFPARFLPANSTVWALKEKRKEWKSKGRVTHGDCSYLASCILHGSHGADVRAILGRRFPVICIDEFQDTGHFLGRAVLNLLAEPGISAIVVGDIDQKIFGFSGVNPSLFDAAGKLAAAELYPLHISQRCAVRVCAVASGLSRSGTTVLPAKAAAGGRAVIAKHANDSTALDLKILESACTLAREGGCANVAVLVRKRVTKAKFLRSAVKASRPVTSRGATQINLALDGLKDRRGRSAIDIAYALVCRVLFGDDRPSDEEMRAEGVEPSVLRRHVRHLLLQVMDADATETWGAWTTRTKNLCDAIAAAFGITTHKMRLGAAFKSRSGDKPDQVRVADVPLQFPWPADLTVEVLTVHEAKGREFDAVLLYCPKPGKAGGTSTCPSDTWWASAAVSEEREIAFVAATRAKLVTMLAVHEKTWTALAASRKDFFNLFEPLPDERP